jgi:hypothetical protein
MAGAGGAGTNGDAGAGIESGAGGSGEAGAGGEAGASCEGGVTSPNEVLWIGDSWLTVPMNQGARERVHDLARGAGVLGADDAYESQVEDGAKMPAVAAQYETQQATGPADVKVLLMDGGTYETLLGMGSQVSIDGAIADFEDFLAKVASDGTVEHIVYVLMPDLIPGVMAMRADMMTLCENSPVPCHFINLQDYWGNPNEYTSLALPTASGAIVIGDAIWAAMQQHCIAQ